MNKNRKWIIAAGGAFVLLSVALGVKFFSSGNPEFEAEEFIPEKGKIQISISTTGTVEPQNRLELRPPIGGRIESILVKEGDVVHAGQTLAQMSSTERAALLDAARMKDTAEFSYWEKVYKTTPVISPIKGKVIVRNIEPGQTVTASDNLFVLSDRLMIKANVDETDIGHIKTGQSVDIQLDAYPDVRVSGKVDHISYESTVVNNVTIYRVEIIPDIIPDVFRSGMSANIEIIQNKKEDVIKLATKAIKYRDGNPFVMLKSDGKRPFHPRKIVTGIADMTHTEIITGLSTEDIVLLVSDEPKIKKRSASKEKNSPFMPQRPRRSGGQKR